MERIKICFFMFTGMLLSVLFTVPSFSQWSIDPAVNNPICTAAGYQWNTLIESDGSGGAVIAWLDRRNGTDTSIYAQHIDASGVIKWDTNGVAVCGLAGARWEPVIVSDDSGGVIIAWSDHRNTTDWDIYAQRIDASGAILWNANGTAICTAAGDQRSPAIVSDDSGGAIIVWMDGRVAPWDIYAQRIDASGTVKWTSNGVVICDTTGTQDFPTICRDGTGGAIITWTDFRRGISNIYARRINASGIVQWNSNGVPMCKNAHGGSSSVVVSDCAGGAIMAWMDSRAGNLDIYAQRVNAVGVVQWDTDGVAICDSAGDQNACEITGGGDGGAIFTWGDYRAGATSDIYAQEIDNSGNIQWTPGGVAICTAANNQYIPQIIRDGEGGAIITWYDYRVPTTDIYAQRINASGAVQWTAGGVPVSTAALYQGRPVITGSGAAGAIIAWMDYRSTAYDIYASRICSDGTLPIQMSYFTASVNASNAVVLEWMTSSEVNNYGFEVQRNSGGQTFRTLPNSFIPGQGTTLEPHRYSYTDNTVTQGTWYYRLRQIDLAGNGTFGPVIKVDAGVLGAKGTAMPVEYSLHQNYPNPFNPSTSITYDLPFESRVVLSIYNALGEQVAVLVEGTKPVGTYTTAWDAAKLPSGPYFCKLEASAVQDPSKGLVRTHRMLLLK